MLLKNINNYGIGTFFKIIFFEIYNIIKFWDLSSIIYDDKMSNKYEFTKQNRTYNTPYIPTPYYFLNIISNFLKKKKSIILFSLILDVDILEHKITSHEVLGNSF